MTVLAAARRLAAMLLRLRITTVSVAFMLAGCGPSVASPISDLSVCVAMEEIHQARVAIREGLAMAEANNAIAAIQAGKRASDLGISAFRQSSPAASAEVKSLAAVIIAVTLDLQTSSQIFTDPDTTPSEMASLTRDSVAMLDVVIAIADELALHGRDGTGGVCPNLAIPSPNAP